MTIMELIRNLRLFANLEDKQMAARTKSNIVDALRRVARKPTGEPKSPVGVRRAPS